MASATCEEPLKLAFVGTPVTRGSLLPLSASQGSCCGPCPTCLRGRNRQRGPWRAHQVIRGPLHRAQHVGSQSPASYLPVPCRWPTKPAAELCFLAALVPTPVGRGWNLLCSFFRVGAPSPKIWPAAGFESLQHSSKTDVTGRGKRCTARDGGLDCVLSRRPGPMQPSVREKPSKTVIRRFSS